MKLLINDMIFIGASPVAVKQVEANEVKVHGKDLPEEVSDFYQA